MSEDYESRVSTSREYISPREAFYKEQLERISALALEKPTSILEDGSIQDYCGGNYDDAFYLGSSEGEKFAYWNAASIAKDAILKGENFYENQ